MSIFIAILFTVCLFFTGRLVENIVYAVKFNKAAPEPYTGVLACILWGMFYYLTH